MMPKRIQLRRTKGWRMPEGTVKVDRSTKWGNPFDFRSPDHCWTAIAYGEKANPAGLRAASVKAYREWMGTKGGMRVQDCGLHVGDEPVSVSPTIEAGPPPDPNELRGKDLACWCPLEDKDGNRVPCHADVLLELANKEPHDEG